jgi:hypothetical protein
VDGSRPEEERPRFARLRDVFHREYGNEVAVYRCDTNRYGDVRIYFLGLNEEGLPASRPSTSRRSITQQRQHQEKATSQQAEVLTG